VKFSLLQSLTYILNCIYQTNTNSQVGYLAVLFTLGWNFNEIKSIIAMNRYRMRSVLC